MLADKRLNRPARQADAELSAALIALDNRVARRLSQSDVVVCKRPGLPLPLDIAALRQRLIPAGDHCEAFHACRPRFSYPFHYSTLQI